MIKLKRNCRTKFFKGVLENETSLIYLLDWNPTHVAEDDLPEKWEIAVSVKTTEKRHRLKESSFIPFLGRFLERISRKWIFYGGEKYDSLWVKIFNNRQEMKRSYCSVYLQVEGWIRRRNLPISISNSIDYWMVGGFVLDVDRTSMIKFDIGKENSKSKKYKFLFIWMRIWLGLMIVF